MSMLVVCEHRRTTSGTQWRGRMQHRTKNARTFKWKWSSKIISPFEGWKGRVIVSLKKTIIRLCVCACVCMCVHVCALTYVCLHVHTTIRVISRLLVPIQHCTLQTLMWLQYWSGGASCEFWRAFSIHVWLYGFNTQMIDCWVQCHLTVPERWHAWCCCK